MFRHCIAFLFLHNNLTNLIFPFSIDCLRETDAKFRHHVQNDNDFINIGYVRKSPTPELHETKVRLLNLMITRLRKRCFCEKTFASFCSTSSSIIRERDYGTNEESELAGCAGNTQGSIYLLSDKHRHLIFTLLQDLLSFLANNIKPKQAIYPPYIHQKLAAKIFSLN